MWTFTFDADLHLTVFKNRTIVFEGSYEAFEADSDVVPPAATCDAIWERYAQLSGTPHCPDCGALHETAGHQTCQYPR